MRSKPLGYFIGFVLGLSVIFTLISCGNGSDSGDLIIDGTISAETAAALQLLGTRDGFAGYNISGLGDSDTSDANGKFQIFGDLGNIPVETLLTISDPGGTISDFVVDTSGSAPFTLILIVNADGTISGSVTPFTPGSDPTAVPTDVVGTPDPTSEATSAPTVAATSPTTTDSGGGFSEEADCFCNDGFGPVAPSFTCADTGGHPTNCVEPTPSVAVGTPAS